MGSSHETQSASPSTLKRESGGNPGKEIRGNPGQRPLTRQKTVLKSSPRRTSFRVSSVRHIFYLFRVVLSAPSGFASMEGLLVLC
jgi:hypothetical protein